MPVSSFVEQEPLRYAKKSFSFKLKNRQTNENQDAKLLGLREDQSWILDAMWLDCSKMRNRVCFDLWNDFNTLYYSNTEPEAVNATHGYPVEMILDGALPWFVYFKRSYRS